MVLAKGCAADTTAQGMYPCCAWSGWIPSGGWVGGSLLVVVCHLCALLEREGGIRVEVVGLVGL